VPVIQFHDLRHTCATLALASDVPMKVVSDRLGHSTMAITANLYTAVLPAVAREAALRIANVVPHTREGSVTAM
jgi:integrase